MENDLSSAREGDKLFHTKYGECVVANAFDDSVSNPLSFKRIRLRFDSHNASIGKDLWIYTNGKENLSDYHPSVFWDEVIITPPPKPRRKIEKIIEEWLNFYPANSRSGGKVYFYSYETKEKADEMADKSNRLGEACHVIHKYTVGE